MTRLLEIDPRVQQALLLAQQRMRAGDLDAVAHPPRRGPQPLAHRRKSQAAARRASRLQQRRTDAARLEAVRSMGFGSVQAYLRQRYVKEHRSLVELRDELATGLSTLRRLLGDAGIPARDRVAATMDKRRMLKLRELRDGLAPDGRRWHQFLRSRLLTGASRSSIARECGRSRSWLTHALDLLEAGR